LREAGAALGEGGIEVTEKALSPFFSFFPFSPPPPLSLHCGSVSQRNERDRGCDVGASGWKVGEQEFFFFFFLSAGVPHPDGAVRVEGAMETLGRRLFSLFFSWTCALRSFRYGDAEGGGGDVDVVAKINDD